MFLQPAGNGLSSEDSVAKLFLHAFARKVAKNCAKTRQFHFFARAETTRSCPLRSVWQVMSSSPAPWKIVFTACA